MKELAPPRTGPRALPHRVLLACSAAAICLAIIGPVQAQEPASYSPVLMIGDSMMRLPGMAIEREMARREDLEGSLFSGIGTGLARLDAFDWLAKIDELCEERKPRTAVVALGANDRQPMQLAEGRGIVQPGTPEWDAEYTLRVGEAMDRLIRGGCKRVIWLLLPPMRDPVVDQHAQRINAIIRAEADLREQVLAHDFSSLVADRRSGGFAERRMDPQTAAAIRVRDTDGIHLSPEGSRILAIALIREYWD